MNTRNELKLTDEEVKSIAEDLEIGMVVYINKETHEVKTVIDTDNYYADTEPWEEDLKEIEENYDKYLEIEKMDSPESYRVMEDFVETVKNEELKKKLELGLSLSKPFRNFKDIIDDEDEYRNIWFSFRDERYIEFVKEQIEIYNESINRGT